MAPLVDLNGLPQEQQCHFLRHSTPAHEQVFEETKCMIAKEVLLKHPDPNKPFIIKTDASDKQIGAVIFQDDIL